MKVSFKTIIALPRKTGLYAKYNSAYRKYHSTESLLRKINSEIIYNMDNEYITLVFYYISVLCSTL